MDSHKDETPSRTQTTIEEDPASQSYTGNDLDSSLDSAKDEPCELALTPEDSTQAPPSTSGTSGGAPIVKPKTQVKEEPAVTLNVPVKHRLEDDDEPVRLSDIPPFKAETKQEDEPDFGLSDIPPFKPYLRFSDRSSRDHDEVDTKSTTYSTFRQRVNNGAQAKMLEIIQDMKLKANALEGWMRLVLKMHLPHSLRGSGMFSEQSEANSEENDEEEDNEEEHDEEAQGIPRPLEEHGESPGASHQKPKDPQQLHVVQLVVGLKDAAETILEGSGLYDWVALAAQGVTNIQR
ncbi:Uu.00g098560.m01.CDS01 [Anthostomella pinea]|uniref:Uu.00g098560.m01.CDS01 n=1 Tax=Anthostomella pinea TaxID=933095 RepID=A0AAI8VD59_9PEZI|nr:Uu.00g098560.m01.CDS01 [Anthostomella pinea]